ncbi:TPA: tRNA pseudouridine(55) synthase TruB, partial [Staphylococcus aureus]|nr:tRNA pseudouridine(55) synthase TruB [Staphylococcus aureus]HDA1838579.1 tRNA pseudouridine(55) synthase TruB [Staphylococcus aureus]
DSHIKKRILNGQKFNKNEFDNKIKDQIVFIDDDSEKVLAIYMVHPTKESEIKPKKVFN